MPHAYIDIFHPSKYWLFLDDSSWFSNPSGSLNPFEPLLFWTFWYTSRDSQKKNRNFEKWICLWLWFTVLSVLGTPWGPLQLYPLKYLMAGPSGECKGHPQRGTGDATFANSCCGSFGQGISVMWSVRPGMSNRELGNLWGFDSIILEYIGQGDSHTRFTCIYIYRIVRDINNIRLDNHRHSYIAAVSIVSEEVLWLGGVSIWYDLPLWGFFRP